MDRPEMDEAIQAVLVQHMATEGAANHDLAGGGDEDFVFVDEQDVGFPESEHGSVSDVTDQMQNMVSSLRDKKNDAPSTAAGSTTAGGSTVQTFTSTASTSTGSGSRGGGSFRPMPRASDD